MKNDHTRMPIAAPAFGSLALFILAYSNYNELIEIDEWNEQKLLNTASTAIFTCLGLFGVGVTIYYSRKSDQGIDPPTPKVLIFAIVGILVMLIGAWTARWMAVA